MTVEAFFAEYEKTISAIGAISTLAAVIVSLWIALRSEKTRLKAYVSGTMIVHSAIDDANRPKFVSVNVINTGLTAIRIPFDFFRWKAPFCKGAWLVNPLDHFHERHPMIPQKIYPVKIEPKHSESFFISDREAFYSEMKKVFLRLKYFPKLRARFITATVRTDDGTWCKVVVSKALKKELVESLEGSL